MQKSAVIRNSGKKILLWIASVLLLYLGIEVLLFRTGLYLQVLEPDSSAGQVETRLYWLDKFRPKDASEVLVVGDSRIAEGFAPRQASQLTGGRTKFWNDGIAGSSPRVWYYFLRDADPTRQRFSSIAIALDRYQDIDRFDNPPARLMDLNYVVNRLNIADVWDFSSSFNPENRRAALVGSLFKGNTLRRDFAEFLRNPRDRVGRTNYAKRTGLTHNENYQGIERTLSALFRDDSGELHFPETATEGDIRTVRDSVRMELPPQTGAVTEYRMHWLRKIVDLYRGSKTKLVFLELPRGPLPIDLLPGAPSNFIDWAKQQSNITVLDSQTFRFLEAPSNYFDGLHLNRKGSALFTARLVESLPE